MNLHLFAMRLREIRFPAAAKLPVLLTAVTAASFPVFASRENAQFDVLISLHSIQTEPQTGVCSSPDTSPSAPTYVCRANPAAGPVARPDPQPQPLPLPSVPTPVEDLVSLPSAPSALEPLPRPAEPVAGGTAPSSLPSAGLHHRHVPNGPGLQGTLDIYTDAAAKAAYRWVSWADREYLEVTVTW